MDGDTGLESGLDSTMAWSTAGKLRVERGQLLAQVTRARRSAALCTLLWESVCIMAHMVRCATVSAL